MKMEIPIYKFNGKLANHHEMNRKFRKIDLFWEFFIKFYLLISTLIEQNDTTFCVGISWAFLIMNWIFPGQLNTTRNSHIKRVLLGIFQRMCR